MMKRTFVAYTLAFVFEVTACRTEDIACVFQKTSGEPPMPYDDCYRVDTLDFCANLCIETEGCVYYTQVSIY